VKRYTLSPEATTDLTEIVSYISKYSGTANARHVLRKIKAAIQFLMEKPQAGHIREDLTSAPVKFWPVFSYLIVYNPSNDPLEIVRILHGRRDVVALLESIDN
jgi:antitoxin ParD1/3/4/toxin ParE1/3/4